MTKKRGERVLGLDLGVRSIGWALVDFTDEESGSIVASGVRVFEAGMEGNIEEGKEESKNQKRRQARMQRRQADRRARRHKRVARLLQKGGLLPGGALGSGDARHAFFQQLDQALLERHAESIEEGARHRFHNTFPYWLRARALEERLEPFELGRALYHLAQRRGFMSNRKAAGEDEEEKSQVKASISELGNKMEEAGSRSLGEYFKEMDPMDPESERIRARWTGRDMFKQEFEAIWTAQAPHHPELLSDGFKKQLFNAMFFQRPLKSQHALIGTCQFECVARGARRDRRRAPWALWAAQRFRMLQGVNNLTVVGPDLRETPLTPEQRGALIERLETEGDLTWGQVRKSLGLKKRDGTLNLERMGEKKLLGNRTTAALRKLFGDRYDDLGADARDAVIEDLISYQKENALARRGQQHWGLSPEQAEAFGRLKLEQDYCNLSRQALAKLLPLLEEGKHYQTAAIEVYGEDEPQWQVGELPPVSHAPLGPLRNPAVFRVLCELRKVMNALIRKYGVPDKIRIEMGRDMRRSKKERQRISKDNRQRQKVREQAKERIVKETGIPTPTRDAIERVLLADECNWECPYSGKRISMQSLLGDASQFDVEHIIPFSRSLDNSYLNKTLCDHEFNRTRKRNQTPAEAFSGEEFEAMLQRVRAFNGDARPAKLKRFQMAGEELEAFLSDFTRSQLNDTRYATRLACKYCGLLYGGAWRKHIEAVSGGITSNLRKAWKMNRILGDGELKVRDDHRHHAVDAITIALTKRALVKRVTAEALVAERKGIERWWKSISPPWDTLLQEATESVNSIVVSRRAERRVRGPLHKESLYSRPKKDDGKIYVHFRKSLSELSPTEVSAIVDPVVRERVKEALASHGGPPKEAFKQRENHPVMKTNNGKRIPIHRVRIRVNVTPKEIGDGHRKRWVKIAANHHMEVIEYADQNGQVKWDDRLVTQMEALERACARAPVVKQDHGEQVTFLFSLAGGDTIMLEMETGNPALFAVRSIWKNRVALVAVADARLKNEIKAAKAWYQPTVDSLRKMNCRKVNVTPLGEVRWAND